MSQAPSDANAPQVEYRRLGQTGLRVSVPIVGAMSMGSSKWMPWVVEEEQSLQILKAAWDRGVTTIDTANMYSNGESERIIGLFLKKYNIPRHRVIILTKCFFVSHEEDKGVVALMRPDLPDSRDYVNHVGLSRAAIFNQVEASLARLQTPYIDLLQIHRFDPNTPIEETMKALHDLVQSGKVRYIGASSMRAWQFADMNAVAERNGWTKFVSMQSEYSLMYREDEREMIPYCKAHGIGLIPWGPLYHGFLARPTAEGSPRGDSMKGTPFDRKFSDAEETIIKRVEEVAKKRGWKMSQVALAWVNAKVSSPIVGISSVQRLEEGILRGKDLTDEEIKYLEEPYVPIPVRGHA